jgi:hypothetical protein
LNAEHQRRGADLDHHEGLVVIILADADGAERQRNCTFRSRSRSFATARPCAG